MACLSSPSSSTFEDDCREAVFALRDALRGLYSETSADPVRPQDVARRFGLNKNLTWKVSRLLQTSNVFDAVHLIPGAEGIEILLSGFAAAGAGAASMQRVRDAQDDFDRLIETHSGDRATLELLVDSRTSSHGLEMSRKLAFRGNSGIWGLQARGRTVTHVLAPNSRDPNTLDIALATGIVDLQRLRPLDRWPLFRFSRYNDDASPTEQSISTLPIDPAREPSDPPWLMPSWCSPRHPPVQCLIGDRALVVELRDGPLGRTGQASIFFGFIERGAVPRLGDERNRVGEAAVSVSLPLESLLFDFIVHRSLAEAHAPEAAVFGLPAGELFAPPHDRGRLRLPISEPIRSMGAASSQVGTPLVPRYDRLLASIFESGGWDARDFVLTRLQLACPPMPSLVVLQYPLPT